MDDVFQHGFCQDHIIVQICKSNLRLDHPELRCMTGRVGVLCTEGRSECIDVTECLCIRLAVQLSAYGQVGRFIEEVFGKIYFSVFCLRNVVQIHGGYLEHLTGTFTVASCDQWSVHIDKSSLLEEFVDRISDQGTYTEHGLESVGSRTQMGNCTQVFHAVAFFLQRIIRCGSALYADLGCLDLKWLFCLWGCHQSSLYDDGCTYVQFGDLCKVLHGIVVYHL